MILSKYRITDILEDIDERFAEEAMDIPQPPEKELYSFKSSKRSFIIRTAAKAGGFAAAAAIAITGILIAKDSLNTVQQGAESSPSASTDSVKDDHSYSSEQLSYEQLMENWQLYENQLNGLSSEKIDFYDTVLENLPYANKTVKSKSVVLKSDWSEVGESLFKAYANNYKPEYYILSDSERAVPSYRSDEEIIYCNEFGKFSYFISDYSAKSSLSLVKSYFLTGINANISADEYMVAGKKLTLSDMVIMAENTANKGAEAINSPIRFKAVKINIYDGREGISFAAYFNLESENTEIWGLRNSEQLLKSINIGGDVTNYAVFDNGKLSHAELCFGEEITADNKEESFCSPVYAAKQLTKIIPENRSYKIQGISAVNIIFPVKSKALSNTKITEPYWVFYTDSGITVGVVSCKTGTAELVMAEQIVLKQDFYK